MRLTAVAETALDGEEWVCHHRVMSRRTFGSIVVCVCLWQMATAGLLAASPSPPPRATPPASGAAPTTSATPGATSPPPAIDTPTPSPLAGTPTPALLPVAPTPAVPPDRLLDYEKVLAERANQFELFLQNLCTTLATVLAGLVALFGVAITIHNRRDVATVKNDIRAEYTKKIGEDLEKAKSDLATEFRQKTDVEITKGKSELESKLQQVEQGMTRQIDEAVKKGTEGLRARLDDLDAEITQPLFYNVVEYASVISHAAAILSREPAKDPETERKQYQERSEVIVRFQKLQDRVLCHRTFNVLLGRLHREQGDYAGAVAALTKAIESRSTTDLRPDEKADYGALLFNRACYRNFLSKEAAAQNRPELAEDHATKAWNDLKVWTILVPDERGEVKDPDLVGLVGRPPRTNWETLWSGDSPETTP